MNLEVDITKRFSNSEIKKSFKLKNNIMIFYGPSGSGKTTILNCIVGLDKPDKGYIILNGKLIYSSKTKLNLPPFKRQIGYIFQEYALFPHLTVLDNINTVKKIEKKCS